MNYFADEKGHFAYIMNPTEHQSLQITLKVKNKNKKKRIKNDGKILTVIRTVILSTEDTG